jgi:hypothetical protein
MNDLLRLDSNKEQYLHQHCDSIDVFWQDGVAHCITCGQPYPPYEPVTLYLSEHFSAATYFHTQASEQRVLLLALQDEEISVEDAEAIGKALSSVPRIKTKGK